MSVMHEPGTDARIWTCDVWWAAHMPVALHTSVTLSGASVYPTGVDDVWLQMQTAQDRTDSIA